MRFAFFKGYQLGDKAVEFLVGPKGQALRKAISVVGGMVIGAVAATWVSVTTALQFKNSEGKVFLNIQEKDRWCLSRSLDSSLHHSLLVVDV